MLPGLLVANGDDKLCEFYGRFLAERGFEVETAPNALDCLAKLRRHPPAALVLDMDLFWGGGDGILAWLREESPMHDVPVILTSAPEFSKQETDIARPPVVACLPRRFGLTVLLETVHNAVANREQRKPAASRRNSVHSEQHIG